MIHARRQQKLHNLFDITAFLPLKMNCFKALPMNRRIFAKTILLPLILIVAASSVPAADEVKPRHILEGKNSLVQLRIKIYSGNEDEFFDEIGIGKFYLLDRDPLSILENANFRLSEESDGLTDKRDSEEPSGSTKGGNNTPNEAASLEAAVRLLILINNEEIFLPPEQSAAGEFWDMFQSSGADEDETALLGLLLLPELKKHTKKSFEFRNPNGIKLLFPRGSFYLFGYVRHQGEIIVWNLPLTIGNSPKIVDLDQYNSSALFLF